MVLRMAAVIGLESGFLSAVAIEIKETCLPGQVCTGQASGMETGQASAHDDGNFWLWLTVIGLLVLVVGLFYKGYSMIKDLAETVQHVWNQVGDEDAYIAEQEQRITALTQRCESLENQMMQFP